MTTAEFSTEFDVLLNSWAIKIPQGSAEVPLVFNEYEKSVFLTKAQEELILELYQEYEKTEEYTEYLDSLLKDITYQNPDKITLPEDLWFRVYEKAIIKDDSLSCNGNTEREVDVVPVTHDEYYRTINSPFRGANERRVLSRLIDNNIVELTSKFPVSSYMVRYISKPSPIILENLPDDLSIEGKKVKTECLLTESLHRKILTNAVTLAIRSRAILANSNTENN